METSQAGREFGDLKWAALRTRTRGFRLFSGFLVPSRTDGLVVWPGACSAGLFGEGVLQRRTVLGGSLGSLSQNRWGNEGCRSILNVCICRAWGRDRWWRPIPSPTLSPSSTVRASLGTLTSARPQPSQPPTVYHTCKQSPLASPHT